MKPYRIFKLDSDHPDKEYFLLDRLCEECFSTGTPVEHAREKRRIIYVSNSSNKVRRLQKHLRAAACFPASPTFVTIKPFFRFLYELIPLNDRPSKRIISESQGEVILRHILLDKKDLLFPETEFSLSAETADFFLKWIRNVKAYNLNITFNSGSLSYRAGAQVIDVSKKEHMYNDRLLRSLASIFDLYQAYLESNDLIDESDREWWIVDHLDESKLSDRVFYIEHLSVLRTVEQMIFRKVYQSARSVSLLDFSYPFCQKQFTTTGIIDEKFETLSISKGKAEKDRTISLRGFQKKEHETEDLARRIAAERPDTDAVIVTAVPDEYDILFERFFHQHLMLPPRNIQRRLAQSPIIKTCLSLFDIIGGNFGRRAVVSFLCSPFVSFLDEADRSLIDRKTREKLIASGDDWKRFRSEGLALGHISDFIDELRSLSGKRGLEFLSHYMQILEKYIVREQQDDMRSMNQLMAFLSSLTREPLSSAIGSFAITDFQRIISSYATTSRTPQDPIYDQRVALLNLEEAAAMNFDTVFLIGLVEGSIPQSPQYNPLFSEKLLEQMGYPTYDLIYDLSKFNFRSILGSAHLVRCSFFEKDEQGNEYIYSPFIHFVEYADEKPAPDGIHTLQDWQMGIGEMVTRGIAIREDMLKDSLFTRASLIREGVERLKDQKRLINVKELLLNSGDLARYAESRMTALSRNLSPSALELYVRCPYRYFLHYVLGLQESEEPEHGVDRMTRGRIIHEILARFLERKISSRISRSMGSEWGILQSIAFKTIEYMAPRARDRILLKLELASDEYESLLQKYLNFESTYHQAHSIKDIEWDFSGKEVSLPFNGDRLGFRGRIDRIDLTKDGLVVFDYKTGIRSGLPSNSKIERGESLQLPIYAFAARQNLGKKIANTAYYLLSNTDGIAVEERRMIPDEQLIQHVHRIWTQIREFNFEPSPASDCMHNCVFAGFCPAMP